MTGIKPGKILVATLVVLIAILHYATGHGQVPSHIFYGDSFFMLLGMPCAILQRRALPPQWYQGLLFRG